MCFFPTSDPPSSLVPPWRSAAIVGSAEPGRRRDGRRPAAWSRRAMMRWKQRAMSGTISVNRTLFDDEISTGAFMITRVVNNMAKNGELMASNRS